MFDIEGQTYTVIKRFRIEIFFVAVALIIPIIAFYFLASNSVGTETPEIEFKSSKKTVPETKIYVDISGAVNNPDVYEVAKGTRLGQLMELAGGISDQADEIYVSKKFNKAKTLVDQDKIYIPTIDDVTNGNYLTGIVPNSKESAAISGSPELIDINEASTKDLETLPGIGETTANKIADNRPYSSIEDLLTKKIVSQSVFTKINTLITP